MFESLKNKHANSDIDKNFTLAVLLVFDTNLLTFWEQATPASVFLLASIQMECFRDDS